MTPEEKNRRAEQDRQMVLAAIAKAEHALSPTTTEAIAQRIKHNHTRAWNAIAGLQRRGLVYNPTAAKSVAEWRLTEQGWHAVGQKPPQWMVASYV